MSVNTTRLGQAGIILAVIGMAILFIPSLKVQNYAFALITFGFLIVIFSYVVDRLRIMGAEYWALGSIIVYIGTTILSIPMLIFSFGIKTTTALQWILAASGVAFILFGFITTKYDLNIKLISTFNKFIAGLQMALEKAVHRFKTSPLISIITVLALFLLFSMFSDIETLLYPILSVLGIAQKERNAQLGATIVMILLIGVETREFIWSFLQFSFNTLVIGAQTFIEWITKLPMYFKKSIRLFRGVLTTSFSYFTIAAVKLQENYQRILEGIPMLSLLGGVGYFIAYLRIGNANLLFISTVLFIVPTTVIFVANPNWVRRRIERVQTFSYQISQRSKRLYKRNRNLQCRSCGNPISKNLINCPSCGGEIESCSICRALITYREDIERCSICSHPLHSEHLDDWIRISSKCPICKEEWKTKKKTFI